MYVCVYGHSYSKSIDQPGRLPVLHVVSWTGKMNISLSAFVPKNLVSRDGFGSPGPRQPAPFQTQAEAGAFTYGIPLEFRGGVHLFFYNRHTPSGQSRVIGSRNCVPMAFTAESPPARASKPQGSSERVLPRQVTMDQLIFASLY